MAGRITVVKLVILFVGLLIGLIGTTTPTQAVLDYSCGTYGSGDFSNGNCKETVSSEGTTSPNTSTKQKTPNIPLAQENSGSVENTSDPRTTITGSDKTPNEVKQNSTNTNTNKTSLQKPPSRWPIIATIAMSVLVVAAGVGLLIAARRKK